MAIPLAKPLPPFADRRWPIVGHIGAFLGDLPATLTRLHQTFGDAYRIALPGRVVWVINRPQDIERIFSSATEFQKDKELRHSRLLFGNGLLTSDGDFWRRQRRLAQPAFHKTRVEGYGQTMVRLTRDFAETWRDGETRDIHGEMMALTLRIATETLFGDGAVSAEAVGANLDVVLEKFEGLNRFLPDWLPVGYAPRYRRGVRALDAVVNGVIARKRAEPGATSRDDLLSILLEARDDDGRGMTDTQLRDEVMTLLLAGHETTGNALSWTWQLLAQDARVEAALHAEVDALGEGPSAADFRRLPYTHAIIQESMRLYPPAWLTARQAAMDVELSCGVLPRGTTTAVSQWVVHRDARLFPEPLRFRPERWLDGSTQGLPAYAYFPFGGGQRLCIGKGFAQLEAVLVLATLARRFRLVRDAPPVALRPSITLRPATPPRFTLVRR